MAVVVLRVPKTGVLFLAALIFVCVAAIPVYSDQNFALSGYPDSSDFGLIGDYGKGQDGVALPNGTNGAVARLLYNNGVQFYNASAGTAASFRTSFVFTISSSSAGLADGLAFFIGQSPSGLPRGSEGGSLGLFNSNISTGVPVDKTTKMVAIEIDTLANANSGFDAAYAPHIGLDLNSLNSTVLSSRSSTASDIRNGSSVGVWVEYSAQVQQISVSISVTVPPIPPTEEAAEVVLTYPNFNLSAWIDETSYVGLSASTGDYVERNVISEWNFSTSFPPAQVVPQTPPPPDGGKSKLGVIVGLGVGLLVLALLFLWLCLRWRRKKQPWREPGAGRRPRAGWRIGAEWNGRHHLQLPEKGFGPRPMAYNSLMKATKGFSTILGEGGFGGVYKGVLLDGSEVAVKKIKQHTRDGEKQFLAEVTTIGKLSHKNLVLLKGWCYDYDELLIVYEYMPKGSLADHLYPEPGAAASQGLDWLTRLSIIRGVADALGYLHGGSKQSVVHRDIKPSNVMLDANFVPKLGDFGLAVAIQQDKDFQTVTGTAGTLGYLAPECVGNLKVGPDSDVYSFGVMVLEMVCGRRPVDWSKPQNENILVNWVWSLHIAEHSLMEAVCPPIRADCKQEEAEMLLRLGLMCTFPNPSNRPSMRTVIQLLEGSLTMPPLPREMPPHFAQSPKTSSAQKYWDIINGLNSTSGARTGSQASTGAEMEAGVIDIRPSSCSAFSSYGDTLEARPCHSAPLLPGTDMSRTRSLDRNSGRRSKEAGSG